jgi:hypothetical protein
MSKITSFGSHRIWYFQFHKFPDTGSTPCLLLKAGRAVPPGKPRGRPKHDPLRASGRHGHGWDPGHVMLGPGQIIMLWAMSSARGLHAKLYARSMSIWQSQQWSAPRTHRGDAAHKGQQGVVWYGFYRGSGSRFSAPAPKRLFNQLIH